MSELPVIATAVKHLIAAGVTGYALVQAIAEMELAGRPQEPKRTPRQERNRRYYEKRLNASENGLNVTEPVLKVSPSDGSPDPSFPSPSKEKNPLKGEKKEKFSLPDWIPADAWRDYEEMRNRIRKPMTDRARVLAVSDLDKLRSEGWDPRTILESAVKNSWQGLFAPKFGATPTGAPSDSITREITRDEYDRAKRMISKAANKKGLQSIIDEYEKRNPTQAGKPSTQPQRQDFSTADAG